MKNFNIDKNDKMMLILIDFQEKLAPQIKDFDKITKRSVIIKKAFDLFGLKSLATEQYPKGLGKTDKRLLELLENDLIVEKTSFNSYTEEIKEIVKKEKIEKIVLVGAETHVCVFQTARALLDDSLDVFIVEDAVSSYDDFLKENGIKNLEKMGANIISTEMLLFDLIVGKDDDSFKDISNFVKELRKI